MKNFELRKIIKEEISKIINKEIPLTPHRNAKETWQKFINTAYRDGLLNDLQFNDKRIVSIAKEIAAEYDRVEDLSKKSVIDNLLYEFYHRIPKWAWDKQRLTSSIKIKYNL